MNKVALLGVRSCVIFCPSVISDCASVSGSVLREEAVSNCNPIDLVRSVVTPCFKWLKNVRPTTLL